MQQRWLGLMRCQPLLNMFNNGVDVAELQPFFRRQFQLPANTLFSKEG